MVDSRLVCGIFGIARAAGNDVPMSDAAVERLRDTMSHRGPDGSGLWRRGHVVLAHRRLAVVDLSPEAAQPMASRDQCGAIVYSGELYNDAEIREALIDDGWAHGFRTRCDTETVLAALTCWGESALARLRGMFALAYFDGARQTLLLARDPLGIKPLYFYLHAGGAPSGGGEIVFASELPAILGHGSVPVRPDLLTISAYLTTIRTSIGNNTLFEGVRTLRPGEAMTLDLSGACRGRAVAGDIGVEVSRCWKREPVGAVAAPGLSLEEAAAQVRETVRESVRRHLRSDVPSCLLLSGGLDSSIIAACAAEAGVASGGLRTYCSGAEGDDPNNDFRFAAHVAEFFGARHRVAPVSRELFGERWREIIAALGAPLSTPNEVAINHVARALRRDGQVVALSGEGADEFFGGYDEPMRRSHVFEFLRRGNARAAARASADPGLHQLHSAAWMPIDLKDRLLNESVWRVLEQDAALQEFYSAEFASIASEVPCDDRGAALEPLEPHLRFLRQMNLAGLLSRLDSATMLASVEGRTPLADRVVADLAESLPMQWKYDTTESRDAMGERADDGGIATLTRTSHTKRILRVAFAEMLPPAVLARPKASFPLPFESWVNDQADALRRSSLARELFSETAITYVAANPGANWRLGWPMLNLALWGQRWWG